MLTVISLFMQGLREVANTIMELAYLHPHPSLHAGKVEVRVSCECRHGKPSSLLSHSTGIHASPASHHMVSFKALTLLGQAADGSDLSIELI
jgi:hypothetical protein